MIRIIAGTAAVALLAVAIVLLVGSGGRSASSTLGSAIKAADRQTSFHVSYSTRSGDDVYTSSADVGDVAGRQEIEVSPGWRARIVVVDDVAYISGNQAGLINYFGFPAAAARKAGSRWVSIPSSNPGFAPASRGALAAAVLTYVTPGGHLTTASARFNGKAATAISGTGPALRPNGPSSSLTLFISKTGAPLPVGAVLKDGQGDRQTLTISAWGKTTTLEAPSNAVAIVTLAH